MIVPKFKVTVAVLEAKKMKCKRQKEELLENIVELRRHADELDKNIEEYREAAELLIAAEEADVS